MLLVRIPGRLRDDRTELQIGDRPPLLAGRMTIRGRDWLVERFVPLEGGVLGRFVLRPLERETPPPMSGESRARERHQRVRQPYRTNG